MYFGADYYPEHWPEERWADDVELMSELNFNVVRMAEFAWAKMEPEEGRYDFGWLDRIIEMLDKKGIKTVLGTPTAAPPPWLTHKHPSILPVDSNRQVKGPGTRCHYCHNSPIYWEYTEKIVTKMAEHYKDNPGVIGWQTDNEFGNHSTTRCYCEDCAEGFRKWLKIRYGDLDTLNKAWGTMFWSHNYTDWEEIPLPWKAPAEHNPSLLLDFYRFSSDSVVAYQKLQIDILRRIVPHHFITHNLMGLFDEIDYFDLAEDLDFVSWDNYHFHGATPAIVALTNDLMWGIKKKNVWVMEQQCGNVNWGPYNPAPKPGEVRLWTYQDIAHGADGIVYFRWRAARIGSEQYHSGILKHDGSPGRVFDEIKQTSEELRKIEDTLEGTAAESEVAILMYYDARWALELQPHNKQFAERGGALAYFSYYYHVYDMDVPMDIIHPEDDLSRYKVVIAPLLLILNDRIVKNLCSYVEKGGNLVVGPRAGFKTWSNLVTDKPLPGELKELLGVEVEEFDSLEPEHSNEISFVYPGISPGEYKVKVWCEILKPTTAQVVAKYTQDYYADEAAVTLNRYGKGRVFYVGTIGEDDLYRKAISWLLLSSDVKPPVFLVPHGVEVNKRVGDGKEIIFLMNHTHEVKYVQLDGVYTDLISGDKLKGVVDLPPLDVKILK